MSGTSHFWSRSRQEKNFGPGPSPGGKKFQVWVPAQKKTFWARSCSEKLLVLVLVKKNFWSRSRSNKHFGPGPGQKKKFGPGPGTTQRISNHHLFSQLKTNVKRKWRLIFLLVFVLIIPRCGQKSLQKFGNLQTNDTSYERRMVQVQCRYFLLTFQQIFFDFLFLRSSRHKIKSFYAYADNLNIGASHLQYCQIFIQFTIQSRLSKPTEIIAIQPRIDHLNPLRTEFFFIAKKQFFYLLNKMAICK